MLMFDPVPVKQEAMDPVSVVSFPELNISLFYSEWYCHGHVWRYSLKLLITQQAFDG